MRTATRTLMILALAVLIAAPLSAADKKKKKGKKGRKAPVAVRVPKGLELTGEQKEQVAALNKEYGPKLAAARKKLALTPEQQKAGAETRKKNKEEGKKGKVANKAVLDAQNLSDEQKEAQKEQRKLRTEVRGKFLALLTPEQKAKVPGGKRGAKKKTGAKKKKKSDS